MAEIAIFGQDRANVSIERDLFRETSLRLDDPSFYPTRGRWMIDRGRSQRRHPSMGRPVAASAKFRRLRDETLVSRRAHARLADAEWGIGAPAERPRGVRGEAPINKENWQFHDEG